MAEVIAVNALQSIVNQIHEALDAEYCNGKKVVWFGHTVYIDMIQKALLSRGKRIDFLIDNDKNKWGWILPDELVIFPPHQILSGYAKDAFVLISSRHQDDMKRQLLESGLKEEQIVILPTPEESERLAHEVLREKLAGLRRIEHRELQLLQLELLKAFRDFCDQNHLKYFLAGGTLLGAIRHRGFIPWDDDIDVYMPYEDYTIFLKNFPKGGRYEAVNWESNEDFVLDFGKLVDNHTILEHSGYPVCWLQGVSICVIPLCGYPADETDIAQKIARNKELDARWYWYYGARDVVETPLQDIRYEILALKNDLSFYNSENIATSHLQALSHQWTSPKEAFESILWEFEGELFSIPAGYDQNLRIRYGNYMKLPPVDQRVMHSFPAYWRKEKDRL